MRRSKLDIVTDRINMMIFLAREGDVGQFAWTLPELTAALDPDRPSSVAADLRWLIGAGFVREAGTVIVNRRVVWVYRSAVTTTLADASPAMIDYLAERITTAHVRKVGN